MANLLGQNIGTNYKGILNLNTLNGNLSGTLQAVTDGDGVASPLTLSTDEVGISRTIALSAGSSNVRLINETYTINNSGAQSGTATGIFLNATETALNGMTHNLMDLQVGGVSRFRVDRLGAATFASSISTSGNIALFNNWAIFSATSNGRLALYDSSGASFGLLQFGGGTNAFPAIKRNGAAIDFRLADDSGFCAIRCSTLSPAYIDMGNTGIYNSEYFSLAFGTGSMNGNGLFVGSGGLVASAILQANSTTKGFLPPRMTTTQVNAIATPAEGLIVHNTTNNGVAYFDGTNWGYLSGAKQNLTGAGGTLNVPFRSGNIVDLTLNSSTTLTFGSHVVGTYIIEVTQGGAGSNTLTFPASVKWSGGVPPTLTTVVGKTDILTFFHDGTFFFGTYSLNH